MSLSGGCQDENQKADTGGAGDESKEQFFEAREPCAGELEHKLPGCEANEKGKAGCEEDGEELPHA